MRPASAAAPTASSSAHHNPNSSTVPRIRAGTEPSSKNGSIAARLNGLVSDSRNAWSGVATTCWRARTMLACTVTLSAAR